MQNSLFLALICALPLGAASSAAADVLISSDPTQNMTCASGVCAPTAPMAVLNATDLANMLMSGDVTVTNGSGANDIDVIAPVSWSTATRLALVANNNKIIVGAPIIVGGRGGLSFQYNPSGPGGDLVFANQGTATFADLKARLVINGTRYVLINTIASLAHRIHNNPLGYYAFATDYDATADGTFAAPPVKDLQGVFEGLGHTISNFQITSTKPAALVNENEGTIRDLMLANVSASGGGAAGALVQSNSGSITHVSVSGVVQSTSTAGGVVAQTQGGTLADITAAVDVQGAGAVGGLVGQATGTIIDCHASGAVVGGTGYTGGLAGSAFYVVLSSATGAVSGDGGQYYSAYIAGLVAYPSYGGNLTISQSYATGAVSGGNRDYVSGMTNSGYVDNSYSTGDVDGGVSAYVGGFAIAGLNTASYSIGHVSGGTSAPRLKPPYVGGFVVFGLSRDKSDYWDLDTSGTDIGCGYKNRHCQSITGLTDSALKSQLPSGFSTKIWGQDPNINQGYPYLLANPPR